MDGWDRWDRWDGLLKPFLFDDGFMPDLGVFCLFFFLDNRWVDDDPE